MRMRMRTSDVAICLMRDSHCLGEKRGLSKGFQSKCYHLRWVDVVDREVYVLGEDRKASGSSQENESVENLSIRY